MQVNKYFCVWCHVVQLNIVLSLQAVPHRLKHYFTQCCYYRKRSNVWAWSNLGTGSRIPKTAYWIRLIQHWITQANEMEVAVAVISTV